jgi:hypothetical protein
MLLCSHAQVTVAQQLWVCQNSKTRNIINNHGAILQRRWTNIMIHPVTWGEDQPVFFGGYSNNCIFFLHPRWLQPNISNAEEPFSHTGCAPQYLNPVGSTFPRGYPYRSYRNHGRLFWCILMKLLCLLSSSIKKCRVEQKHLGPN